MISKNLDSWRMIIILIVLSVIALMIACEEESVTETKDKGVCRLDFEEPIQYDSVGWICYAAIAADFDNDSSNYEIVMPSYGADSISILWGSYHPDYKTADSPFAVITSDFDGDGYKDLATANFASNNISVKLNLGNATFGPAVLYDVGIKPRSLVAADFNDDNNLDLAVANDSSNSVSVLFGNGDGTFITDSAYNAGSMPYAITAADLNCDGVPDLAVTNYSKDSMSVLMNDGTGVFQPLVNYRVADAPVAILAADFNGDSLNDLAVTNSIPGGSSGSVSIFINDTAACGTFGTSADYGAGHIPQSIYAADLDNDDDLDIISPSYNASDSIRVLLNRGDGTFSTIGPKYGAGDGIRSVVAADFNGDGYNDLGFAAQLSNVASILLNYGDTMFAAAVDYAVSDKPKAIVSSDLDGDGFNDLIVVNYYDTVCYDCVKWQTPDSLVCLQWEEVPGLSGDSCAYESGSVLVMLNGSGLFAAPVKYAAGIGPVAVYTADLDNDFDYDLAVADYLTDSVRILQNDDNGVFVDTLGFVVGDAPRAVFAADFNADNNLDLAVANDSSDNVTVLLGNGDGTFPAGVNYNAGDAPSAIYSADVDADTSFDLIVVNEMSDNISVLLGNGDGTFQTAVDYSVGTAPQAVVVADFGGDTTLDLAVANAGSDNVSVLLGNGDGSFQTAVDYATGISPSAVSAMDFDDDGYMDLAVSSRSSNSVLILLGDSLSTFTSMLAYGTGVGPVAMMSADLDDDGDYDIATVNEISNNVSVLMNHGAVLFEPAMEYVSDESPVSVSAADLDNDADFDLVTASSILDKINVFLNQGYGWLIASGQEDIEDIGSTQTNDPNSIFQKVVKIGAGQGPWDVFAADLDGDNDNDLAVANDISGSVSILINVADSGTFGISGNYATGNRSRSIDGADIDGDGDIDLAVGNASASGVSVLFNEGDGRFRGDDNYHVTKPVGAAKVGGAILYSITRGVSDTDELNNSGSPKTSADFDIGDDTWSVYLTDLDDDNFVDLALCDFSLDTAFVLFNDHNGNFGGMDQVAYGYPVGEAPRSIHSADFNNDGLNDLVVANYNSADITVLLNNGDLTFSSASYGVGIKPTSVFAVDLDDDGHPDLAVTNYLDGTVTTLTNNGSGSFDDKCIFTVGAEAISVFGYDLDNDTDNDLLIAKRGYTGGITILYNKLK